MKLERKKKSNRKESKINSNKKMDHIWNKNKSKLNVKGWN